jgi:ABC-type transport system involved in cytochrome c biogenesis ATPase subunit
MKLVKVGLEGYARFRARQELDVDAPLIAIIGPNEAGKTSMLRALLQLNGNGAFDSPEISRRFGGTTEVWARYVLADADRSAMPEEAAGVRQLVVTKRQSGSLEFEFEPAIHRDQPKREKQVDAALAAAEALRPPPPPEHDDEEYVDEHAELRSYLEEMSSTLVAIRESTDDTVPGSLTNALTLLRDRAQEREYAGLADALDTVVVYETSHPFDRAREIASRRRPHFIEFTEADLQVPDARGFDDGPTQGLENLLALGGTTWDALVAADEDRGHMRGLLKTVNAAINVGLKEWNQDIVEVELDVDARVLKVLVATSADDYIGFDQRSSGLRMFVALCAFVAQHQPRVPPVLLIDEAERHLHYDAQADLVRVLSEQQQAATVIYTTHSAGCLPADLGTGIRAIEPVEDTEGPDQSRLVANFFESEHGIRPLLIALGASTFALSLRHAVFVEGISDAVLLPVLLRQVTGMGDLPFQVLPGISKAGAEHARQLEESARGVVYVLDADAAGQARREEMINEWNIDGDRIFLLPPDTDGTGEATLEDLLVNDVYWAAVVVQVQAWNGGVDFDNLELPDRGRSTAVHSWATGKGISPPGKSAIAGRVLERRRNDEDGAPVDLVAEQFRLPLRELYRALGDALGTGT